MSSMSLSAPSGKICRTCLEAELSKLKEELCNVQKMHVASVHDLDEHNWVDDHRIMIEKDHWYITVEDVEKLISKWQVGSDE